MRDEIFWAIDSCVTDPYERDTKGRLLVFDDEEEAERYISQNFSSSEVELLLIRPVKIKISRT